MSHNSYLRTRLVQTDKFLFHNPSLNWRHPSFVCESGTNYSASVGTNVAMLVFFLIACGSGIAILRQPERAADGFRALARGLYSERVVQKVYTARRVKAAGVGFLTFALLCLGILIWRLMNGFGSI